MRQEFGIILIADIHKARKPFTLNRSYAKKLTHVGEYVMDKTSRGGIRWESDCFLQSGLMQRSR